MTVLTLISHPLCPFVQRAALEKGMTVVAEGEVPHAHWIFATDERAGGCLIQLVAMSQAASSVGQ
jgi:hypothetical protein